MKLRAIIEGVEYKSTLQELALMNHRGPSCRKTSIEKRDREACESCSFYGINEKVYEGKMRCDDLNIVTRWLAEKPSNEPDVYTGLQDSDKVDIYSGDILEFNYNPIMGQYSGIFNLISEVYYDNEKACYCVIAKNKDPEKSIKLGLFQVINEKCKIKIIGNIHEEVVE